MRRALEKFCIAKKYIYQKVITIIIVIIKNRIILLYHIITGINTLLQHSKKMLSYFKDSTLSQLYKPIIALIKDTIKCFYSNIYKPFFVLYYNIHYNSKKCYKKFHIFNNTSCRDLSKRAIKCLLQLFWIAIVSIISCRATKSDKVNFFYMFNLSFDISFLF